MLQLLATGLYQQNDGFVVVFLVNEVNCCFVAVECGLVRLLGHVWESVKIHCGFSIPSACMFMLLLSSPSVYSPNNWIH